MDIHYFHFRRKSISIIAATIDATKSDIGILIQTPNDSKNVGNISNPGIKNSTCRESEKNIARPAIPIHWKKLETTI